MVPIIEVNGRHMLNCPHRAYLATLNRVKVQPARRRHVIVLTAQNPTVVLCSVKPTT